jgi:hypothetical protein
MTLGEKYVSVTFVLRLLALVPLANTQKFLIYALSYSVQRSSIATVPLH